MARPGKVLMGVCTWGYVELRSVANAQCSLQDLDNRLARWSPTLPAWEQEHDPRWEHGFIIEGGTLQLLDDEAIRRGEWASVRLSWGATREEWKACSLPSTSGEGFTMRTSRTTLPPIRSIVFPDVTRQRRPSHSSYGGSHQPFGQTLVEKPADAEPDKDHPLVKDEGMTRAPSL